MSGYERMFAGWARGGDDRAARNATRSLRHWLAEAGAVPISPIWLAVSSTSAAFDARTVTLAECRALILRHDNPFPKINLFRWGRTFALAASCALLAISLLGMFTDQEKEPQMRAGSTSTATPLNGDGRP